MKNNSGLVLITIGLILLSIGLPSSLKVNWPSVLNGIAWIIVGFRQLATKEDEP